MSPVLIEPLIGIQKCEPRSDGAEETPQAADSWITGQHLARKFTKKQKICFVLFTYLLAISQI
jgi:hypothetical protein